MNVIPFPVNIKEKSMNERITQIDAMIQARFGVSAAEYYTNKRTDEVQQKINRALLKETLYYASKND
ncbi:hypothetical protein L2089_15635 [Paenibacillus hunanensis]|uniref:hypothetical protein n=1 Tax=Paenibacillus hunanensis TaxID=539262 RepID=UPI0020268B0E|nr:hypothetical protein [Paenibacillus hunanensis]MCL9662126.1 hypothetical protein [Paenibacillus hunanensis]